MPGAALIQFVQAIYKRLRIGSQLNSQVCLLSGSVVLVQETLGASLIDLLHSSLDSLSSVLVAVYDCKISLLDSSLELGLESLVLLSLDSVDTNSLLRRT